MRASSKKGGKASELYIPWISAIVFFVKDRKCLVYPHRRALTFNRTLIDCGIYFFSYISPVSATIVRALALSLSFSPSLSGRSPFCIPNVALFIPNHPARQTGLSFPFCFRSPTAVQIGEIKPRDGAAAVIRRLHFSIMATRGRIVALF